MDWKLAETEVLLKVDWERKDDVKELGAKYNGDLKCWYIPIGKNLLRFRDYWSVLECPYESREIVKRKGARFDKNSKKWYVPSNLDYDKFYKFWPQELKKFLFNEKFAGWRAITSGQSDVIFGYDIKEGTYVAIKIFNETYDDERTKEAFYREYDTLVNKLGETKGILKLMDFGKHDITKFFFHVSEYCPLTLLHVIDQPIEKQFDIYKSKVFEEFQDMSDEDREELEAEFTSIFLKEKENYDKNGSWIYHKDDLLDILNLLCETFKKGINHRDIKPANIFLRWNLEDYDDDNDDEYMVWLLGDFGISKLHNAGPTIHQLTTQDTRSIPWRPPISLKEKKFQDTWDVYSWAAIVVSSVLHVHPNSDEELLELIPKFKDKVSKNIFTIINQCLHEEPEKRPQNVLELKKMIDNEITS